MINIDEMMKTGPKLILIGIISSIVGFMIQNIFPNIIPGTIVWLFSLGIIVIGFLLPILRKESKKT